MEKINNYPGPYHWYQSRFQYMKYYRQFELAREHIKKNSVVLDFGCGDGKMTSLLSDISRRIYGVDNQERAINFAKLMTFNKNISFKKTYNDILFPNNFFDVVVCFDVIEHIPIHLVHYVIYEIKRVLKRNGLLILTTPNRCSLNNRIFGHNIDPKHYYEYSFEELDNLLKSEGFHVKEKKGIYLQPILRFEKLANLSIFNNLFKILVNLGAEFPNISEKLFIVCFKK